MHAWENNKNILCESISQQVYGLRIPVQNYNDLNLLTQFIYDLEDLRTLIEPSLRSGFYNKRLNHI